MSKYVAHNAGTKLVCQYQQSFSILYPEDHVLGDGTMKREARCFYEHHFIIMVP